MRSATWMALCSALIGCATAGSPPRRVARDQITILYDAFGRDPAMRKDWGFAALVEVGGHRILFDTGDDPATFAANVAAAKVDLRDLDFVVMSHRHGDHMGGLTHLLSVNPAAKIYAPKEGFGVYGGSLPGTFYRKDTSLPADMRYYDGRPPDVMRFGSAWPTARFELVDGTTQLAPGVWLIALVSDAPGTRELKELSLAIDTPDGLALVVGCSHPGIEAIVSAATEVTGKRVKLLAGGMHLVVAPDDVIARVVSSLRGKVDRVAPGHCTGEPTFAALRNAFGDRYLYAGVGTVIPLAGAGLASRVRGTDGALSASDLATYERLIRDDDHLQPTRTGLAHR
jgi:7,8-dihydropterin-6-yl-methyl-4-(beta-D-ribofuranosyl)aminobenzene 5'-phosphate synthase